MTAETLRPFITPQNVESFPTVHPNVATKQQYHRKINLITIGISLITLISLVFFSGYTIWLSTRVSNTESEITRLNRVIESLQKHLGIHYLEEMQEFEKQYQNALIDNPSSFDYIEADYDDDDDDEEDDDGDNDDIIDDKDKDSVDKSVSKHKLIKEDVSTSEDVINYDEQIAEYLKKFNNYDDDELDEDEDTDVVTGDSLYNDFEKYKDSKTKDENIRVTRSITQAPTESQQNVNFKKTNEQMEHVDFAAVNLLSSSTETPPQRLSRLSSTTEENTTRRHAGFVRTDYMESKHRSPLRQRSNRRQRFPVKKSAKNPTYMNTRRNEALTSTSSPSSSSTIKPAAHFHLYHKIKHQHATHRDDRYQGDVYIAHHPSWSNEVASEHYFQVKGDILTVREPGLYYVYAQICYNNTYDQNGFVIFHNHNPLLQCLNTVPTNRDKLHTCHTSGLVYLRENETIHIRDFHTDRDAVLKNLNNRSYFGLMKV